MTFRELYFMNCAWNMDEKVYIKVIGDTEVTIDGLTFKAILEGARYADGRYIKDLPVTFFGEDFVVLNGIKGERI
jgi:hypothetical protein